MLRIPARSAAPYIFFLAMAACSGPGDRKGTGTNETTADVYSSGEKYIVLEDAPVFLTDWSGENIIVYHTIAEPDNLHPTNGTSAMRNAIFQYIHRSLVHLDYRTLKITNGILKNVPVLENDDVTYHCELRKGVTWDDGSQITAYDVIFTAKANKCKFTDNPHAKPYWDNLEDVIPDPENELKFTVKMSTPYMHNLVFWGDWPILQESIYDPRGLLASFNMSSISGQDQPSDRIAILESWAAGFNEAAVGRDPSRISGAGMYRISEWDPGISVTLTRKSSHWSHGSDRITETSYPEKIIYRVNRDPNSQILDFKSQVYDGSNYLSTKTLLELRKDSVFNRNYHSRFTDSFNYTYIAMNMRPDGETRKKIFDDKLVRKAMAHLTPVDDLNSIINKGLNKRMNGPVSYLKDDHDTTVTSLPFDPEKANQLLDKAGWTDSDGDNIRDKMIDGELIPLEFQINYMTNTTDWKDYATICMESYERSGMKVNLNPLDFSVFVSNARKHDFDMMIGVWGQSAYPEDFSQLWHTSSWISEGTNYPGFGNDQTDALIDSIKVITDPEERRPLVYRFQQIVMEEQPLIFLFSSIRKNVIHKRFGNAEMYFERPGILLNNLKLLSPDQQLP